MQEVIKYLKANAPRLRNINKSLFNHKNLILHENIWCNVDISIEC